MGRLQRLIDFVTFNDLPAARVQPEPPSVRAVGSTPISYQIGKPMWPAANPRTFVQQGYGNVVTAYRCINIIANAVGSIPVRVYSEDASGLQEAAGHPLRQLMRRPNPFLSESEFMNAVTKISAATGVCVIEKERSAGGRVIALWPLRTDWLRPIPRSDGSHDWEYLMPDGQRFTLVAEDVIVATYEADPFGSPFGVAPLAVAHRDVTIENSLIDFTKTFLQRGAVPQYGLIPREGTDLTQEEADALRERWQQRYGGITNSAEIAVLAGIEDVRRIGLDYNEMAYLDLRDLTAVQICSAFGVPPILVGVKPGLDASTYSNYEQARRAFWEDTITPLLARLDGALTRGLLVEFLDRPDLSLEFDLSGVMALQDDVGPAWARAGAGVTQGWLTVNDARREVGLPEVADGDVFLRGLNTLEEDADDAAPVRAVAVRQTRVSAETVERRALGARRNAERIARRFAPRIERFLEQQGERVSAWVATRAATPGIELRGVTDGYDWAEEERLLRELIDELYVTAGRTAWQATASQGFDVAWSTSNPRVQALLETLGQRIVGINETTRRAVAEVVLAGVTEGQTIPQLAEAIQETIAGISEGRATTIARTESAQAYNQAAVESYRSTGIAGEFVLYDNAEHDTDPGEPTGTTCSERNGTRIPFDGPDTNGFTVDDYTASMHPNCIMSIGFQPAATADL